jgi:diguanylate cyclase (GGDEF)-like protein
MVVVAAVRRRDASRRVWVALSIGVGMFFVGDVLWTMDTRVWHVTPFPSLADVFYVSGYPVLSLGLAWLVRRRHPGGDWAAVLDAAIITTGLGVLVGVEVVLPAMTDSTASMMSRVVYSAYPLGDLLLLAMVARLAFTSGRRLPAFWALIAGVAAVLVSDAVYNVLVINGANTDTIPWLDVGWMELYLLVGVAAMHRSAPMLMGAVLRPDEGLGRVRLLLLSVAAVLAPGTLLLQVVRGQPPYPVFVGVGSIVLFLLVLLRVGGLLRQVQTQSALLAVMARSDALTGMPNRGTWDHELIRMTGDAREHGRELTVALFDLDNFKGYNDTRGHIAGDRLLQELSSAWRSQLSGRGLLARYGGEEFALAVPAMPLAEVEEIVRSLCALVPDGQTASAGVAARDPFESRAGLMSRVDSALYASKRSGRDAVSTAGMATGATEHAIRTGQALTPRPVFQPIVDLGTGRIVAVEALSRFDTSDLPPDEVFARAWLRGHGPELEAEAIHAALQARGQFGDLKIHVNVSARGLVTAQVREALPADLHSVVLEITEQDISSDSMGTARMLDEFRRRGATLAIDDFGVGFSNLRRMIGLRPEIIKLDRSLIKGIEHSAGIRAIIAAVAHQARLSGCVVCAEGVESQAELHTLLGLGVPQGQGYLFSRGVPAAEAVRLMSLSTGLIFSGEPGGAGAAQAFGTLTAATPR